MSTVTKQKQSIQEEREVKNLDIRMLVSDKRITYRAIADRMGITHTHLSRLMREELKPMQRERILAAISYLDEGKEA